MNFENANIMNIESSTCFLKNECKIDVGFCSQKTSSKIRSATTTAIIIYVLKTLRLINNAEEKVYCDELLSFQILSGSNAGAFGTDSKDFVWATSQACLALEAAGIHEERLDSAIKWLCNVQTHNGGWNFNGSCHVAPSIEYCLYPLLAISKYINQNAYTDKALQRGYSYVMDYNTTSTFSKIVRLYLLKKVYKIETDAYLEHQCLGSLCRDILRDFSGDKIVDSDESHFYVELYLPAYYLLIRAFSKPDNPISLYLLKLLNDSIIDSKGWAPSFRHEPYSWTTALSMLTVFLWISDCRKLGLDSTCMIERMNSIKKGDLAVQTYVERCPLNGGICNKIDDINRSYSCKKIFLDIPYNAEYLTFEEELIKTIKKNGLIPVMAKDTIKSKAILCKICQLIQESKFGLADVSYPTHNIPFELGLLLGLSKNCVILKKRDAQIPSDISGLEYVEYQNTIELRSKLAQWIIDNR